MTLRRHCSSQERPAATWRGFSLVELMVAITLGLIITAAVTQIFVATRSAYTLEEGLSRTQENGRFAMEFLTQDIRMAGYSGCVGNLTLGTVTGSGPGIGCTTSLCNIVSPPAAATNFVSAGIVGYTYVGPGNTLTAWDPDLPSDFFADGVVKANTDVIISQYGSPLSTHLTGNTSPQNANVKILNNAGLAPQVQPGDVLMLSDCKSATVFKATGVSNISSNPVTIAHAMTGNTDDFLPHLYDDSAELMKMVSHVYYIGTGASGEPTLMRRELTTGGGMSSPQEMVEGIEDMRIVYGQDTDGNRVADIYRKANAVNDWNQVVSVRIGILARTTSDVETVASDQPFQLAGISVPAFNDKRRRQAYNTTIRLRN